MGTRRGAVLLILSLYVLFILDLTWFQFPSSHPAANPVPLRSIIADWKAGGRDWIVNFVGNIVAFVPIGMIPVAVRPRSARARHAALFCLALSALIEAVQYASGRRVADVDDLILNTAGGLLGYAIARSWWPRRRFPLHSKRERPDGGASPHPGGPARS